MRLYEQLGFKSENDFVRFCTEFGDAWGMTLIMINPAYAGILAKAFNIPAGSTIDSIDKNKAFFSQIGLIPTPTMPHSGEENNTEINR